MKKIQYFIFVVIFCVSPSVFAGCVAYGNVAYYWVEPSAEIDISYSRGVIQSDTPENTRIGTMTVLFRCPYSVAGVSWGYDNKAGGQKGYLNVPLPEFNYINERRMEHKSGWVYIVPEGNTNGLFRTANGNSWNLPYIGFIGFGDAISRQHSYGIYSKKIPANVTTSSQVISMLRTGKNIVYRAGGFSPSNKNVISTVTNNNYTLKYTNTVTCTVTNNGNNFDLGTVNTLGDFNTPLATLIFTMKCGLGTSGGNMTSNYPSFIVAGSARMNSVTSGDAKTSEWLASSNSVGFRIGNGWGIRFKTGDAVNINTLNNISIPIYPYKYGVSQGSGVDWNGAVTFEISYN